MKYTRTIRLKYMFNDMNTQKYTKFRTPNPHFSPLPIRKHLLIERFLESLENITYNDLNININRRKINNLNKKDRISLHNLTNNNNITITNADKNLGITILDTSWYNQQIDQHLNNTLNYCLVTNDNFNTNFMTIYNELNTLHTNTVLSKTKRHEQRNLINFLRSNTKQTIPYFYILPKIHKSTLESRPITAAHKWILTPFAKWIADILNPYVQQIPTYLKNSNELIELLDTLQPQRITNLITGDVTSLYTNIDLQLLYLIISDLLEKNREIIESKHNIKIVTITKLLYLLLNEGYVTHKEKIYKQIHGIPMGCPASPQFATLYVHHFEKLILKNCIHIDKIIVWKRYIDDILLICNIDESSLEELLQFYNQTHNKLMITWNINTTFAEYLDLYIFKSNFNNMNKELSLINYKTHQKTLNTYLYVPYSSYHRRSMLKGFITGELLRYIRNSSNEEYFNETKQKFYYRLRSRGYPHHFIHPIFEQYNYKDRNELRKKKDQNNKMILQLPNCPLFQNITLQKLLEASKPTSDLMLKSNHWRFLDFTICWRTSPNLMKLLENKNNHK
jgi:hypothetical protein